MSSLFGGKNEEKALVPVDDGQAEINIFTVASGHLYEVGVMERSLKYQH